MQVAPQLLPNSLVVFDQTPDTFVNCTALYCRTLLSRYPEALVVPDLTQDVRFKDSPIVTEWPKARFYAACPLVAHTGSRLGTL